MQKNKSETLLYYSTCIEKFSRIDIMYIVNVYLLFVLVSLFSLPHILFLIILMVRSCAFMFFAFSEGIEFIYSPCVLL
jgi:hypothetical protein